VLQILRAKHDARIKWEKTLLQHMEEVRNVCVCVCCVCVYVCVCVCVYVCVCVCVCYK
jgi:hypothetical protein